MRNEDEYQNWIREMFEKYAQILFLQKYRMVSEKDKDPETYLASKCLYPYLDIKILYSDKAIADWEKDRREAEYRIVHEFCHTVTDPLFAIATQRYITKTELNDARERLTDHIAQIVNKRFGT